jgi:hypothetical protein
VDKAVALRIILNIDGAPPRKTVYVRSLDPSVLVLVFHHTDTHI